MSEDSAPIWLPSRTEGGQSDGLSGLEALTHAGHERTPPGIYFQYGKGTCEILKKINSQFH